MERHLRVVSEEPCDSQEEVEATGSYYKNRIEIENPLSLDRPVRNPNSFGFDTKKLGDTLVGKTLSPEEQCIYAESTRRVLLLLRTSDLNWAQKRAMSMYILEDLNPAEIANILGAKSPDGTQNLINSALAKIQNHPLFPRIVEDHF